MSELIAPGTAQADSADFTVVAGSPKTLYIKPNAINGPPPSGQDYYLQHKTSAGFYSTVAVLNASNIAALGLVSGAGTFRVQRQVSAYSTGMDIEG